ncbi:hypothetical protein [Arthrobacter crystallopoietes]|uniref:hypothetical protein n=1 Tax=Crystallibacter crystallopoietes TaxID=37928 RepID=UPI001FC9F6B1|nr:hypothetical protein [Arthrobacter crystallopoietes]
MSMRPGGPPAAMGSPPAADGPPAPVSIDVPVLADGVQLLGQAQGSGYREPPALVRRADGQTIQLTPLLYAVLEGVDGNRNLEQIADFAGTRTGRLITADNVRTLIAKQLLPLGLLQLADGSQPEVKKASPLLGMRFRYTVTDPERTRRLTAPFAALFHPLIALPVVAAFLAACWWVLLVKGLGSATHEAFANPGLLLLVFAITILSAGFHEFGHAAAARRGGATPGAMGVGLYLIWPAFYTDVTDSYRLGRGGRIRTDLGGLYFNAMVVVSTMSVWWFTGFDALLLVVVTQILQMVRQLLPLIRFDGYHILADATGVPDLFQRIKPTLLGLLPWRWSDPEPKLLKPWARAVVTVWVLVTVPLLLFCLLMMVVSLPRVLGTAWASVLEQQRLLAEASSDGDVAGMAVRVLAIIAVALPILGIAYILLRMARQLLTAVWAKTRGRPLRRVTAIAAAAAVLAGLAWAWWPDDGAYRPVQPYERGTLFDATASLTSASSVGLAEGRAGQTVTAWPSGTDLPTAENPQLAMVLVPRDNQAGSSETGSAETSEDQANDGDSGATAVEPATADAPPSWVFPFDRPLAPEDDGNQALAVNTEDGSVVYDVAFALVWAEDGPVDATNEAYAFASCRDCTAVAVGFQVVLILGQADVVVPQNLSAAANYNCVDCLTYALASQLVLTLDGPLSEAGMDELTALWEEIAAYGRSLEDVPLDEIQSRLNDYKARILGIIEKDDATSGGSSSTEAESDADTDVDSDTQPTQEQDTDEEPQQAPVSTTVAPEPDTSDPKPSSDATSPADTGSEQQPAPAQEPTGEPAPDTATSPPAPLTTTTPQPAPAPAQEPAPAPAPADEPAPAPTG